MKCFTIRADIKKSRTNLKYNKLEKLITKINEVQNSEHRLESIIDLQVRNGDEIFGVYKNPELFMDILKKLIVESKNLNIPLYVGIGVGNIDENIKDSNLINGSSIWYATEALKNAEIHNKRYDIMINKDLSFSIKMENESIGNIIKTLLFTFFTILTKRTVEQIKSVDLYEKYPKTSKAKLYGMLTNKKIINATEKQISSSVRLFDKFLYRAQYNFVNDIIENIIFLIKEDL